MKHLKLFFALFAMLALGVGNAWGAEATLSSISTKNVVTTKGQSVSTTFGDVTCKVTRNSGNQPGFYTSSGIVRYYSEDVMTLSVPSGNTITKVVFTMNSGNVGTVDVGTVSNNTWTGNAESISFTGTETVKITKIVVTYEATSGGQTPEPDPDPTPDPTPDPEPEPEPGTGGEETWTLVTNASDLKAGDEVVIAAKDYNYAISTTQNSNNRGQASITKSGDNITFGSDVQILTLEAGTKSSTFGLNTGSGYLYASSSSGNQLKTQSTNNDNGSWSISISSGTATIKASGTNTRNVMQYNQSSSLFACYSSASQKALAIYKKVTSTDEPGSGETVVSLLPKKC